MSTAALFLAFNRPEPTRHVCEAIRQAAPPRRRPYVAADAPRAGREAESACYEEAHRIGTAIDWAGDLKTMLREEDLACKKRRE
jgi:hypothetical protein